MYYIKRERGRSSANVFSDFTLNMKEMFFLSGLFMSNLLKFSALFSSAVQDPFGFTHLRPSHSSDLTMAHGGYTLRWIESLFSCCWSFDSLPNILRCTNRLERSDVFLSK